MTTRSKNWFFLFQFYKLQVWQQSKSISWPKVETKRSSLLFQNLLLLSQKPKSLTTNTCQKINLKVSKNCSTLLNLSFMRKSKIEMLQVSQNQRPKKCIIMWPSKLQNKKSTLLQIFKNWTSLKNQVLIKTSKLQKRDQSKKKRLLTKMAMNLQKKNPQMVVLILITLIKTTQLKTITFWKHFKTCLSQTPFLIFCKNR